MNEIHRRFQKISFGTNLSPVMSNTQYLVTVPQSGHLPANLSAAHSDKAC